MARDQAERYRQVAEAALGQLDWRIGDRNVIRTSRAPGQKVREP